MSFVIRQACHQDLESLHHLAASLSAYGFLNLPATKEELKILLDRSERSFAGKVSPDEGIYLFALEEGEKGEVIGTSQIVARHGTPPSPHLYFQVDLRRQTLKFVAETTGRTELGGLILDPAWRGLKEKLGKRLSWVRLWYLRKYPERFHDELIAEFLPPLTAEGKSLFWEALGRKWTGLDYQEADRRARKDKKFVLKTFPQREIEFKKLPLEVQRLVGVPGTGATGAVKVLEEAGFRYLHQIDPFDGGPHYGAKQNDIRHGLIQKFLLGGTKVKIVLQSS